MRALLAFAGIAVAACVHPARAPAPAPASASAGLAAPLAEVQWFKGDPQLAFSRAKSERKPIFLFWGAVWCPPCNQIKKTIVARREFVEKSRLFIPVYLDGDTESAQLWGEKLGISSYPTLLVYSPDGQEIMRLPTGLQLVDFLRLLDEALGRMMPLSSVLDEALKASDPARIPDQSWRLLAYYSWGQDVAVRLKPAEAIEKFKQLDTRVPARLVAEKSRFYCLWLGAVLDQAGGKPLALRPDEVAAADVRISEILEHPALIMANYEFLSSRSAEVVKALHPTDGAARERLSALWERSIAASEANGHLSVDERVMALLPAVELGRLASGDRPLEHGLIARVKARVAWADQQATDGYTRQTAMSSAGALLEEAGLTAEAKALYLAQLQKAPSPHVFMSHLAALAKKAGEKPAAIDWMAQAYEKAPGRASRFQWGTMYLVGLMELIPEDAARIHAASLAVFQEMLGFSDAFAGRNHKRVEQLARMYAKWNAKDCHAADIAALREALAPKCAALSGEGSLRSACTDFFAKLGK